jgi:hypothetical protein
MHFAFKLFEFEALEVSTNVDNSTYLCNGFFHLVSLSPYRPLAGDYSAEWWPAGGWLGFTH